ncbi:hypothetical protein BC793_102135 [Actinoplanes xinjiangensis]|uniref:Uncharacterized protein n=1 Tax=Actinoplanes xinjiangensis TaxID=512350 RepID=A0A316FQR1_9ACTN|nr:hypothetical protein BC793_102135 [Actinoplanes xinjiangensis]
MPNDPTTKPARAVRTAGASGVVAAVPSSRPFPRRSRARRPAGSTTCARPRRKPRRSGPASVPEKPGPASPGGWPPARTRIPTTTSGSRAMPMTRTRPTIRPPGTAPQEGRRRRDNGPARCREPLRSRRVLCRPVVFRLARLRPDPSRPVLIRPVLFRPAPVRPALFPLVPVRPVLCRPAPVGPVLFLPVPIRPVLMRPVLFRQVFRPVLLRPGRFRRGVVGSSGPVRVTPGRLVLGRLAPHSGRAVCRRGRRRPVRFRRVRFRRVRCRRGRSARVRCRPVVFRPGRCRSTSSRAAAGVDRVPLDSGHPVGRRALFRPVFFPRVLLRRVLLRLVLLRLVLLRPVRCRPVKAGTVKACPVRVFPGRLFLVGVFLVRCLLVPFRVRCRRALAGVVPHRVAALRSARRRVVDADRSRRTRPGRCSPASRRRVGRRCHRPATHPRFR